MIPVTEENSQAGTVEHESSGVVFVSTLFPKHIGPLQESVF